MKKNPSMIDDADMIFVRGIEKTFTLHNQGGIEIPVLRAVSVTARRGECLVLRGPSGVGKSTLLRALYGNYRIQAGAIWVRHGDHVVDIVGASPRQVIEIRRRTIGYVSQFLRAVPRVPAIDVVAEPLIALGERAAHARDKAAAVLRRMNIPERLWLLAPATFSGGQQQRINVARGLIVDYPILLLDEPTASLDADNRDVVGALIGDALRRGACVVGTFHDDALPQALGAKFFEMAALTSAP
ncbi:phosphonate C-P lyase system protein PhnL [Varunaivibrio sulfuroxidans]|uniref:Alpha-D-ribose 1-methylphosphonate 5-triphosphate synthase subunit PhnL n=1 Tax=Varunaivibrio sulfuroxidans TaxID=1773489 RepID=A0A4V2UP22_9PROT|nr:phosphonate C-P lyase system protein PhnL [Varunaivibrio sulfuroxidans]TCS64291.1 alpha-D-ribose 1-methylphosphonate 5-triphosphate synthase subunit PhnL [Varunaivibrio sulfuroxidans]WES31272.1 phosphonate C-P lyase system protein PhnL [Varunaivibrio sulfuroxidans]